MYGSVQTHKEDPADLNDTIGVCVVDYVEREVCEEAVIVLL